MFIFLGCMNFSVDLLSALRGIVDDVKWHRIGSVDKLKKNKVTKLFPDIEDDDEMVVQPDDVILFYIKDSEFYAIDCSCPHAGGSLELGDIEDINNEMTVICPWHAYDFNLKTGESSTGLKTNVYEIKIVDDFLYIKCDHKLSQIKSILDDVNLNSDGCTTYSGIVGDKVDSNSLSGYAKLILNTAEPTKKVTITQKVYEDWKSGTVLEIGHECMPVEPKRQENLVTKAPGQIKRGKGGTLKTRIAILHSLANIEQWAIDLAWDIIGRFSQTKINHEPLPVEFFADFLKVANDEAKHFKLIEKRLSELGSFFGSLPVHNGLWQSAQETSHDLLARLAIVHMVHEARGLDVQPKTAQRFLSQNDGESFDLLNLVYEDEITHVACGMKWFNYVCQNSKPPLDPVSTFHKMVKKHFKGYLKPPFNSTGRNIAGMTEEWYSPLVKPENKS